MIRQTVIKRIGDSLLSTAAALIFTTSTANSAEGNCDNKCLSGYMDQYLSALAKRDPTGLPISPTIKVAENSHSIALGENLWNVVVKIRDQKHYFTDPQAGQVLALGVLELNAAEPFIYNVRLKIENRLITEVETMVTSDKIAGQHFKPENMAAFDPLYLTTVPAAQRTSRDDLLSTAKSVWYDEAKGKSFASDCVHSENADRLVQYRCSPIPKNGTGGMFTAQRAVRHELIDVERGVIVSYALQDATPRPRTPPAGEKTPIFYQRPVTFYVMQLLKVSDGQIRGDSLFANIQEANAPAPFAAPMAPMMPPNAASGGPASR